jgi:hypothetical protein
MAKLTGALLAVAFAVACKGKVEYRDNPEVVSKLEACQKGLDEKAKYIKDLEARVAELEMKPAGQGEVVVMLSGPLPDGAIMEIKGGAGPHGASAPPSEPRGNADDEKLYEAFIAAVKSSRGSIRKCYQNALKKDTSLQARTVTLDIAVDYGTSGKVSGSTFSPRISQHFNECMAVIAGRWKLPAMPRAVTFKARQLLTPE